MSKNILAITIIITFLVVGVWFFLNKSKNSVNQSNLDTGQSPSLTFSASPTPGNIIELQGGLKLYDLVVGTGKEAQNGDTLSTHYVGTLEDETVFDSSYDRGQPLQFVLGSGQLIQGWELGLVGMKEGGKRKLIIPPTLGYGSKGAGGVIPSNATLLFEIELINIVKK